MKARIGDEGGVPAAGDRVRLILKAKGFGEWIEARRQHRRGRLNVGDVLMLETRWAQQYDQDGNPKGPKIEDQASADAVPRNVTIGFYGSLSIREGTDPAWIEAAEQAYRLSERGRSPKLPAFCRTRRQISTTVRVRNLQQLLWLLWLVLGLQLSTILLLLTGPVSALVRYSFEGHRIRVSTDEHGEAWFAAADVTAALGQQPIARGLANLGEEEHCPYSQEGPGSEGCTLALISEGGLLRLQLRNTEDNWQLTEAGRDWGMALPRCSRGEHRQQIVWDPAVVALLQGER